MTRKNVRIAALFLSAAIVLSGCDSAEERAEGHFDSAMELLESGDVARAIVEFRNVFQLNPDHAEARLAFARTLKGSGDLGGAYAQYRRVSELQPDTLEPLIEMSEIAILSQNWEEAERNGRAAAAIAPDDLRVRIVTAALDYFQGQRDENPVAAAMAAENATALLQEAPDSLIARQIAVDHAMRSGNMDTALQLIEGGLEQAPDNFALHSAKLGILLNQRDMPAIGATLRDMVVQFPENEDIQRMLISYYVDQDDMDSAEAFLRDVANADDATRDQKLALVQFLKQVRGGDAARAEIQSLIDSQQDDVVFRILLASLDFEEGKQAEAIASLEGIVAANGDMTEDIGHARLVLARMLLASGNSVGSRSQVETILENDPSHVEALKMRAAWLIDEDNPDAAILDLRTALSEEPRDADIMTLMGRAHERAGSRGLAGERYALAVEVSMQAPEESLRYAEFLVRDGRTESAIAVLTEALNRAPDNIGLLQAQAGLKLRSEDWNDVTRIIWRLRALEDPRAAAVANGLEADLMLRQERVDETISFLEGLADEAGSNSDTALSALIQTKVRAGQVDEAVQMVDERLAEAPQSPALRFLRAGLYMLENDRDSAAAIYENLLEEYPGNARVMRLLHTILVARGDDDAAGAMVDRQIERAANPAPAMFLKAERLEREKDFEGAIAIYEDLYERNSNNIIVANNLASLITTHRDDEADLERAYTIARRLRGIENPALQDTYGWIAYRQGNYDEALEYLEKAAAGLPQEPLVQYHLGMTYRALDRLDDARATLERAVELAGEDPLPQYDRARQVLGEMGTE